MKGGVTKVPAIESPWPTGRVSTMPDGCEFGASLGDGGEHSSVSASGGVRLPYLVRKAHGAS